MFSRCLTMHVYSLLLGALMLVVILVVLVVDDSYYSYGPDLPLNQS